MDSSPGESGRPTRGAFAARDWGLIALGGLAMFLLGFPALTAIMTVAPMLLAAGVVALVVHRGRSRGLRPARIAVSAGLLTAALLAYLWVLYAPRTEAVPWDLVALHEGGEILVLAVDHAAADDPDACTSYAGGELRERSGDVRIGVWAEGDRRWPMPGEVCEQPGTHLIEVRLDAPLADRALSGCRPDGVSLRDHAERHEPRCGDVRRERMDEVVRAVPIDVLGEGPQP